jgi:hypothetical protein
MKRKKKQLKPISFYGLKPEDVIKAFMQVDPKRLKEGQGTKYKVVESKKENDEK